MKLPDDNIYQCEVCGRMGTHYEIETHEPACRERAEKYRELYKQRIDDGIVWATEDPAVRLLLEYDLVDDAEYLVERWVSDYLWECGTSSGFHETVGAILNAVRKEASA